MKRRLLTNSIVSVLALSVLLLQTGCGKKTTVARIDNYLISLDELKSSFLSDKNKEQAKALPFEQIEAHLDKLIEKRLMLIDAYRSGLDKDSTFQQQAQRVERREVYRAVIERNIMDKIIPESLIKSTYEKRQKEVRLSEIFLPLEKTKQEGSGENLLDQLKGIRYRLMKGEDFKLLNKEFSQKAGTFNKGGDLGFIKWSQGSYDEEFYEKAFALDVKQVSSLFKTSKGYHILKAEEIRSIPQPSYDVQRGNLRQELIQLNWSVLQKAYDDFTARLKSHYRLAYNQENIAILISKIKESGESTNGYPEAKRPNLLFDQIRKEDSTKVLVAYRGGSYAISQLIENVSKLRGVKRENFETAEKVENVLDQIVLPELIAKWGFDKGYQNDNAIQQKLLQEKEPALIQLAEKRNVRDKINLTEEDYQKYFDEHSNKYWEPEKRVVQEIFVHSGQLATQIAQRAKNKEDFDKLVEKYTEKSQAKSKKGILGTITKEQFGPIGITAFQINVGEIAGPIKTTNGYSIIRVLDKQEKQRMKFKETINQVTRDCRFELQEALRNNWLKELKRNSNVQIYQGALGKAFPEG
jgi:peptidyl-prolyl cis-trans isomerase C